MLAADVENAVALSLGKPLISAEDAVLRDTEVYRKKLDQCLVEYQPNSPMWHVLAFKLLMPVLVLLVFFVGRWVLDGFNPAQ